MCACLSLGSGGPDQLRIPFPLLLMANSHPGDSHYRSKVIVDGHTVLGARVSQKVESVGDSTGHCHGSFGPWEGEAICFYPVSPGLARGWHFPSLEGTPPSPRAQAGRVPSWDGPSFPPYRVHQTGETPNRAGGFLGEVALQGDLQERGVGRPPVERSPQGAAEGGVCRVRD